MRRDTGALLRQLAEEWRAAGRDPSSGWEPGLSADSVRAALGATTLGTDRNIVATRPILDWFGWHNGSSTREPMPISGYQLLSLEEAIAVRSDARETAATLDENAELVGPFFDGALPILRGQSGDLMLVDCVTDEAEVFCIGHGEWPERPAFCPPLPVLAGVWLQMFRDGVYFLGPQGWERDLARTPVGWARFV